MQLIRLHAGQFCTLLKNFPAAPLPAPASPSRVYCLHLAHHQPPQALRCAHDTQGLT